MNVTLGIIDDSQAMESMSLQLLMHNINILIEVVWSDKLRTTNIPILRCLKSRNTVDCRDTRQSSGRRRWRDREARASESIRLPCTRQTKWGQLCGPILPHRKIARRRSWWRWPWHYSEWCGVADTSHQIPACTCQGILTEINSELTS